MSNFELPRDINIEVVDSVERCNQTCTEILHRLRNSVCGYLVAGFHVVGTPSALSTIQLCCEDKRCFVFELQNYSIFDCSDLLSLLTNENFFKVGVDFQQSARQLEKAFPEKLSGYLKGFLDLNHQQSLADIVARFLDNKFSANTTQSASDSSRSRSSTITRIQSATVVAYAAFAAYCEIRRTITESNGLPSWTTRRAGKLIFEELQGKECPFPPLSHRELWELFQSSSSNALDSQATIRDVTAEDMYAMFSCSTAEDLQKIVFKTILQVEVDPVKYFMWKFWQSIVFLKDEELDQLEESVEVLIHGYNKFFENDPDKVQVDSVLSSLIDDKKLMVYRGTYILLTSNERLIRRRRFIDELELDKGTVVVSPANLSPNVVAVGHSARGIIRISNIAFDENLISLDFIYVNCFAAREHAVRVFPLTLVDNYGVETTSGLELPILLPPRWHLDCTIECTPTELGVLEAMVILKFDCFSIGRHIQIRCGDVTLLNHLQPSEPYSRPPGRKVSIYDEKEKIEYGERPQLILRSNAPYVPPKPYRLPHQVKWLCSQGKDAEDLARERLSTLCFQNYRRNFKFLLWLEEVQMRKDILFYSMEGITLSYIAPSSREDHPYLSLHVPGLAEKRPSVLVGDAVIISESGNPHAKKFKVYAHRIQESSIYLKFNDSFYYNHSPQQRYKVDFDFNRKMLCMCHQGLSRVNPSKNLPNPPIAKWLFPGDILVPQEILGSTTAEVNLINKDLNNFQKLAVRNIVHAYGRQVPYIVFGPPGTGKTVTLVEAILQVGLLRPESKILICAPSNPAANVLLQRLAQHLSNKELFRFVAHHVSAEEIMGLASDESLLSYCKYDNDDNCFVFPEVEVFLRYKYVIATCAMAANLKNYGIPAGHFNVVFVDEAGQATEPEVISSFVNLIDFSLSSPQLILAGDPRQLGPIVRSEAARVGGLGLSFMERILYNSKVYAMIEGQESDELFDPAAITMLRKCYRCHPVILEQSNKLFYKGLLSYSGHDRVVNNMLDCKHLLCKRFPLIFHGVNGQDAREGSSPSWFNPVEVTVVMLYVAKLLQDNNIRVSGGEIGIITPYLKQAQKIREALALAAEDSGSAEFHNIQVGTCEQFQGKESRVVIISTVRSTASHLQGDGKFNLGFVKNPKRFNVAVTRAQALLIIVGNPYLLQRDPCWGSMIRFCHYKGAYTGCVWPLPGQGPDGEHDETCEDKDIKDDSWNKHEGGNTKIKKESDSDDEISSYYDSSDNEEYIAIPKKSKKRSLSRSVFITPSPKKKSRVVKIEK